VNREKRGLSQLREQQLQPKGLIYRVTESGRKSLSDASVPADYRRILRFIDTEAHSDVIRSAFRRYPDRLILEWLDELTELQWVIAGPEKDGHDLDFTLDIRVPELLKEDQQQLIADCQRALDSLARSGVYVADDRIANRTPLNKARKDIDVLIVEDDPDQLRLAKLRVAMAGYGVSTAETASALRECLTKESIPDLVLLDVMLPDGDGLDILANIRRNPRLALLPVVLLTAKDAPADIETGLALGADGYITKPYSKAALAEVVRYVLACEA
jgi:two-component system OmpR family response regulator